MTKRIKKTCIGLLASMAVLFPIISFANTEALETATDKILALVEGSTEKLHQVSDALDAYMMKYEDNQQVTDILMTLKSMLFDDFYQVEDYLSCESYYDGCNTCTIMEDGMMACTKRACLEYEEPYCIQYQSPDGQDPITAEEEGCVEEGGNYLPLYDECEGIDEFSCELLGGEFEECGSACRHDPDADVCTLQCVQYCDFSQKRGELADAQMELDAAMSLWEEQNIETYTLVQSNSCFCPREYTRPIQYDVEASTVDQDSAYYNDEDQEKIDPDMSPKLNTIEDAFAIIQDAIDQGAATIDVVYDEELGYPTSIAINYSVMIADEEAYYTFELQ